MESIATAEAIPKHGKRKVALGALALLGGLFVALAISGGASADAADTAQISPHPCIDELVEVLVPGQVEGIADMTSDLQAALENGPTELSGEITDGVFTTNDGLIIEIQPGSVECDLDGGY